MKEPSPPASLPMGNAYSAFLWQRWPRRLQQLSRMAVAGSGLLLLLDGPWVASATTGSVSTGLALVFLRFMGLLLAIGALLFRSLKSGPWVSLGCLALWMLASQASFYLAGTQRSMPHAALLLLCLLLTPLVLPLQTAGRIVFYSLVGVSHALMEFLLAPQDALVPRLMGIATLSVSTVAIALSLRSTLRALQRLFFLKLKIGSASRTLKTSRAQVNEATETLARLVETLQNSTLELSSDSARARMETERITQASEAVARMAQAASERAFGASSIVSQATGHTERIDAQMERVKGGMNSIGHAIGRTEGSLRELVNHARQIVSFTNTLQEFANQTDVLALNASLEAARAGEAGRSFAVVAREVRKLSEASKGSSVKINEVVRGIHEQLDSTLKGMGAIRQNTSQFENNFADARKTLESIRDIVTRIEQMMRSTMEDATAQAGATGAIFSGAAQLQGLVEAHAQMSAGVAVTADQLGHLADELRELLPKKEAGAAASSASQLPASTLASPPSPHSSKAVA
ncbi:methyl-accepting chemotaxis protein [Stigmatella aurantiaca]|nr:methyl-accepting chemotaxis protein [Stigmatella aurantiaca]ADO68372.1 Methyl-accepting chemotaxis protein (MCP) signaling domain protein [Stigmatella aurantiaca DW4/3-1]